MSSIITTARTTVDRVLGRVSMYALVVGILTAIALLALVLSLTGVLFFDPLAWLVSLAVALLPTTAATWSGGLVLELLAVVPLLCAVPSLFHELATSKLLHTLAPGAAPPAPSSAIQRSAPSWRVS